MKRLHNIVTWRTLPTDAPPDEQVTFEFVRARTRAATRLPFASWTEVGHILAKDPELVRYIEAGEVT